MEIIDFSNMNIKEVKMFIDNFKINSDKHFDELILKLEDDNRKSVKIYAEKLRKESLKIQEEVLRVQSLYDFDKNYGKGFIVGVDEVGRGPLAGPIVGAAVVLDLDYMKDETLILNINDSKKLNKTTRERLSKEIKEKAISYAIFEVDNKRIDNIGIAKANNEVLKKSVETLSVTPSIVISDGYTIKNLKYNNKCVIKGDNKSASIACASIIAKVYRDDLMQKYAQKYTEYHFEKNVGYGTKEHIEAIKKNGITSIHRRSFLKNLTDYL
ncbi:ribonuclease HII [Clostridium sp. DL1XJH146]